MSDAPTLPPPARRLSALRGLWPFLRPYRARLLLAFLLLGLASAAVLSVPLALRDLIDHGFAADRNIHPYFLALFGIALVWGLTVAARFYQVSWLGERVTADLRRAVYDNLLRQTPAYFEVTRTGEVLSRLTNDSTLVQTLVGSSVSMGLRSTVQALGGLLMLALTSPRLFLVTLLLLLLVVLPLIAVGRAVRRVSRAAQDRVADSAALAGEVLNAMPTVQAFTAEAAEGRRFRDSVEHSFQVALQRTRLRAALTGGAIIGVFGAVVFVLWLGAQAVQQGQLSPGELAAFVLYAGFTAGGLGVLAEVWGDVMRAAGATERLLELLHAPPALPSPARPQALPAAPQARIEIAGLGFRYPSRPEVAALAEIDLVIAPGETVALVGPSGAGKTTLFQLLLRYYDPGQGAIRFNGVDLRALDPAALRAQIGLVPQDPVIFSDDALGNIRYGRPEADAAAVRAAARLAHADEFIERLPQGYATFLGERGTRLSGGQRQRLAIARAILRDPPLLLLDEATSALDAESEALVQDGLAAAMRGRTTLIIAHRLSTVRRADRIVVLEQGSIVEQGPPAQLLRQGGSFARLARLQWVDADAA